MRVEIPRAVWERLRIQAGKLSPEGKKVARALLHKTLDDLARDDLPTPPSRYDLTPLTTGLRTGPVSTPYRVFHVIRNPFAGSLTRNRA